MAGEKIQATGLVLREKGNGFFDVSVTMGSNESVILCKISGKMRMHDIRIIAGDLVDIEIDLYNLNIGTIKFRRKDGAKNGK